MLDRNLRRTVAWMIAIRAVMGTLLLGSATFAQITAPGSFPVNPFFFLIGLTYALSVIYLSTLKYVDRYPWIADAQLGVDAILVSAFIHVTGGITSYFSSLYLLPIMAASTVRFRRGALQVATLSALLYLALVIAQYIEPTAFFPASWQALRSQELPSQRFAQYTVAINLFGFFAVALLSGSLAENLRSAGARLERASTQIADLRAFNQYVIDSMLSGLVTADMDGRILTFNRAASTITGLSAGQTVGRDVGDVLQLPAQFRARLQMLGETRSHRADHQYRSPDGRMLEIGLTVTTLSLPDGRSGYLFTFQDVTDVRRLERGARMQQRLAAVGEMAAGIAHEIRNPLASMSGSIQVLRQELPLSEEQAQLMDIVLKESERLNDTIKSFLAYARPQRVALTRLDIRRAVQDTATLLRNSSEVHDDHVIDVDLPAEPVWIDADENQIRQIVWNLATNGLRAMASGGRLLMSAGTERDAEQDELSITISDEGCGIPPADLDSLFQPFRSSFDKGTGLGLATVHRIVTDYNGSIQVSSTPGSGTTVRVRIPMRSTDPAPREASVVTAGRGART
jgi:two-component system sensor histidine kinase PilS (NtrC family)